MHNFEKLSNLLIALEELGLPSELVTGGISYVRFRITLKSGRAIYVRSSVSFDMNNSKEILHIFRDKLS